METSITSYCVEYILSVNIIQISRFLNWGVYTMGGREQLLLFVMYVSFILPTYQTNGTQIDLLEIPQHDKKAKRDVGQIRVNDVSASDITTMFFPDATEKAIEKYNHRNTYNHHNKYDHHNKNNHHSSKKYDDYGKYGKPKDEKHRNKKFDIKEKLEMESCMYFMPKFEKYECAAFYLTTTVGDNKAVLLSSVRGARLDLASVFIPDGVNSVHLFSNWARGAHCPNRDIEFGFAYSNGTTSVGRYRFANKIANVAYERLVEGGVDFRRWGPFVTSILIPKGMFHVDAYQTEFDAEVFPPSFTQVDVNPKTNTQVETIPFLTPCFDTLFFNKETSRFLCLGMFGGLRVSYLRDPSVNCNYLPPASNNPQIYSNHFEWYTGSLVCGHARFASIGYNTSTGSWSFVRSKLSLKMPYFYDIEEIYQTTIAPAHNSFIYTPAFSNVILACVGRVFWRFDYAYTEPAPLTPTAENANPGWNGNCMRIAGFKECPLNVYVSTDEGELWYSQDGGFLFRPVDTGDFDLNNINALTGFAYKPESKLK